MLFCLRPGIEFSITNAYYYCYYYYLEKSKKVECQDTEETGRSVLSGVGWILRDGEIYLEESKKVKCQDTEETEVSQCDETKLV